MPAFLTTIKKVQRALKCPFCGRTYGVGGKIHYFYVTGAGVCPACKRFMTSTNESNTN